MRNACLISLAMLGSFGGVGTFGLGCSGKPADQGDGGGAGGHAASGAGGHAGSGGGQAGAAAGAAGSAAGAAGSAAGAAGSAGVGGSIIPSGAGGTGGAAGQAGAGGIGTGGTSGTGGGAAGAGGTGGSGGATGAGGAAGRAGAGGSGNGGTAATGGGGGAAGQAGASGIGTGGTGGTDGSGGATGAGGGAGQAGAGGTAPPGLRLLAGGLGGPGNVDGTGAAARFGAPSGVAGDGAGNLYVVDSANNTIRKIVIATGAVTTFAGAAGQYGSADGTGAAARFSYPCGIAGDGAGNLYVADMYNYTIRKIVIATAAVTTLAGAAGQNGSTDGTGAAARFYGPSAIVGDGAGTLYVADTNRSDITNYNTIRKVVIATGAVTTLADWTGEGGNAPGGIASDGAGNLYVAVDQTILQVAIATGEITTLAGMAREFGSADGTGAAARFYSPFGVACDGAGNLYVVDTSNGTIRKIVIATAAVTTLAGTARQYGSADGMGAAARFVFPYGIAGDGAGNLYVADSGIIRKVVIATAAVTTLAGAAHQYGSADGMGAAASFTLPTGIASDGAGNLYVADTRNCTIRKIVIATGAVTTLAGMAGVPGDDDGTGASAHFVTPTGIASDGAGNLYVADGIIRKIVIATGAVTTLTTGPGREIWESGPAGIASDGAGNLYFDEAATTIWKVDIATGALTKIAGTAGQYGSADGTGAAASFGAPHGIASDGAGNLYVADTGNGTIRKIVIATRAVTTLAGAAGQLDSADGTGAAARFSAPQGIASDRAGNLYVADGHTIRKVDIATATVSTVIGSPGRIGVSLGPLPASLSLPYGVAVPPTRELAIVDYAENAVLIGHL